MSLTVIGQAYLESFTTLIFIVDAFPPQSLREIGFGNHRVLSGRALGWARLAGWGCPRPLSMRRRLRTRPVSLS
ncbi:hypothetical protein BFN67_06710 [Pseudaminobacter manganicus]|uniref:Uncharacterized protein n=1 Tax=Manganibacter manganicus TaxID=1873176 RepID=A0A1V8RLD7_9HYPH|nr:hypothetical protein BFN67_06710 [Pseudaminobacter manganicus]